MVVLSSTATEAYVPTPNPFTIIVLLVLTSRGSTSEESEKRSPFIGARRSGKLPEPSLSTHSSNFGAIRGIPALA